MSYKSVTIYISGILMFISNGKFSIKFWAEGLLTEFLSKSLVIKCYNF